jgi:hypothetical protein
MLTPITTLMEISYLSELVKEMTRIGVPKTFASFTTSSLIAMRVLLNDLRLGARVIWVCFLMLTSAYVMGDADRELADEGKDVMSFPAAKSVKIVTVSCFTLSYEAMSDISLGQMPVMVKSRESRSPKGAEEKTCLSRDCSGLLCVMYGGLPQHCLLISVSLDALRVHISNEERCTSVSLSSKDQAWRTIRSDLGPTFYGATSVGRYHISFVSFTLNTTEEDYIYNA